MNLDSTVVLGAVFFSLVAAIPLGILISFSRTVRRQAHAGGYEKVSAYLRAAPRNDRERRDAVDLALKGVVICVVSLLFPPLLLLGLVPLYHGTRKVCYSWMGLELLDEDVAPSA